MTQRPESVGKMLAELKELLVRALAVNSDYDRLLVALSKERDLYKHRVVELSARVQELQKRAEEAEIGRALAVDDRLDMLRASGELQDRLRELQMKLQKEKF